MGQKYSICIEFLTVDPIKYKLYHHVWDNSSEWKGLNNKVTIAYVYKPKIHAYCKSYPQCFFLNLTLKTSFAVTDSNIIIIVQAINSKLILLVPIYGIAFKD